MENPLGAILATATHLLTAGMLSLMSKRIQHDSSELVFPDCWVMISWLYYGISVEQGFQKPQGYTGKGLEGRGQGIEYLTPHKPLPLSKGMGIPLVLLAGKLNFYFFVNNLHQQINVPEGPDRPRLGETTGKFMSWLHILSLITVSLSTSSNLGLLWWANLFIFPLVIHWG